MVVMSCAAGTACEAVGYFNPGTRYLEPFAESWGWHDLDGQDMQRRINHWRRNRMRFHVLRPRRAARSAMRPMAT